MSAFTRLTTLVNANINSLLEQAEDPDKMVLLMIQEMEETLVEVRSASAGQIAARKEMTERAAYYRRQETVWEEKAEYALRKGRDDLARGALREKAAAAEAAAQVERDIAAADTHLATLKTDTARLEAKLREVKVRQKSLVMRGKTASTRLRVRRQLDGSDSVGGVLDRIDAYERRMDEMEGTLEAQELGSHTLASEIGKLEEEDRIERELEALRARVERTS